MSESLLDTAELDHERRVLVRYLMQRVTMRDWHAVSDAANDLRVLEAYFAGRARRSPLTVPPSPPSV